MDQTRGRMMAMTMVGGDHFFLSRWVGYYGRQLGRENLFVLSHGGDPEHRKIAEGCNVIYLPFDETRNCFNQRRWQMLSRLTTGFTNFYNWVLVGDVDEIVCVDPAVSDSLPDYLAQYAVRGGPKVITPFAVPLLITPLSPASKRLKELRAGIAGALTGAAGAGFCAVAVTAGAARGAKAFAAGTGGGITFTFTGAAVDSAAGAAVCWRNSREKDKVPLMSAGALELMTNATSFKTPT